MFSNMRFMLAWQVVGLASYDGSFVWVKDFLRLFSIFICIFSYIFPNKELVVWRIFCLGKVLIFLFFSFFFHICFHFSRSCRVGPIWRIFCLVKAETMRRPANLSQPTHLFSCSMLTARDFFLHFFSFLFTTLSNKQYECVFSPLISSWCMDVVVVMLPACRWQP